MSCLTLAETQYTMWRGDGTIAGIAARIEDGVGREVGFWSGDKGYGYTGQTIMVYMSGRNHQTSFSAALTPDEARQLAASLIAMAGRIDHE